MNKDTIIGFILIAAVLIGFSWWNQPSAEDIEAARLQDSISAVVKEKAEKAQQQAAQKVLAKADSAIVADTTALFHAAQNGTSQQVVLKNQKLELTLDTKGGVIKKAVIKGFKSIDQTDDVTLFDEQDQQLNFMLAGKQENIVTQDLYFTPSEQTDTTVTMTATASNGGQVIMRYRLGRDYMVSLSLQAKGLAGLFAPSYREIEIGWSDHCRQQEKGFSFESRYTGLFYKEAKGGTDNLSETSDEHETIEERLDWVAFRNQFFSVALISKDDFTGGAQLSSVQDEKGSGYLKQFDAKLKTDYRPQQFPSDSGCRAAEPVWQGPRPGAVGQPRLVAAALDQPLVYALCLRLADWSGTEYGYCPHPHHHPAESHHLPNGEEELYVECQDARAQA